MHGRYLSLYMRSEPTNRANITTKNYVFVRNYNIIMIIFVVNLLTEYRNSSVRAKNYGAFNENVMKKKNVL